MGNKQTAEMGKVQISTSKMSLNLCLWLAVVALLAIPLVGANCGDTDNGATNTYDSACATYTAYPSMCGQYDDDDFKSHEMCCACGGGTDWIPPSNCGDTDNGATNTYDSACATYTAYPSMCGQYDDDDFKSHEMCCA